MLPLDKEYPGGVTAFRVTIWADTGEISYFTPIGFYGDPNAVASPEPQQTTSPTAQAVGEQPSNTHDWHCSSGSSNSHRGLSVL